MFQSCILLSKHLLDKLFDDKHDKIAFYVLKLIMSVKFVIQFFFNSQVSSVVQYMQCIHVSTQNTKCIKQIQ